MNKVLRRFVLVALIATTTAAVSAPMHKSRSRLATTRQLMEGMLHANYLAIENAATAVRTDVQSWNALAINPALLNEASYLIVEDDRSLGTSWDDAAEQLRAGSADMLAKIAAREKTGIESSLKVIAKACTDCHAAHR